MRFYLVVLGLIFLNPFTLKATNYYTTTSGDFTSVIWSTVSHGSAATTTPDASCDITIAGSDVIYIAHPVTINCNISMAGGAQIIILSGGSFTITGNGNMTGNGKITVDIGGELNVSGNLNVGGSGDMTINGTVNVGGNFYNGDNNGNIICGTGELNVGSGAPPVGWDDDNCNSIVLPIELMYFMAEPQNEVVNLYWSTVSENNNDYFTVERSFNGIDFEDVGIVDGAGNSAAVLNYALADDKPLRGISYYRLRQTDFDSSVTRSHTIAVDRNTGAEQEISVFPNPAEAGANLTLNLSGFEGEEVTISLFDVSGRVLYTIAFPVRERYRSIALAPGKSLAAGTYLVTVSSPKLFSGRNIIIR